MKTSLAFRERAGRRSAQAGAVVAALLATGACSTAGPNQSEDAGGVDYRQDRFEQVSALQDFRKCRDRALKLDRQARESGNRGQFLASAKLLDDCRSNLEHKAANAAKPERIRAMALTIQNYVKGGDPAAAAKRLKSFRATFPNKDLYLANGASFTATMSAILGQTDDSQLGRLSTLNTAGVVKDELRRMRHWQHN